MFEWHSFDGKSLPSMGLTTADLREKFSPCPGAARARRQAGDLSAAGLTLPLLPPLLLLLPGPGAAASPADGVRATLLGLTTTDLSERSFRLVGGPPEVADTLLGEPGAAGLTLPLLLLLLLLPLPGAGAAASPANGVRAMSPPGGGGGGGGGGVPAAAPPASQLASASEFDKRYQDL